MHSSLISTFVFTLLSFISIAQELYNPDTVLSTTHQKPKVLLVGSYHFAYYNFDAHKTEKDKQVDVFSTERQAEIEELVEYIARFKPTKIAVENHPHSNDLMEYYRAYLDGTRPLGRDEQEQIGFRLMEQFALDTIYGVDADGLANELFNSEDTSLNTLAGSIFQEYDYRSDDPMSLKYRELYRLEDSLKLVTTMLQYFKHLNSDKMLARGYGSYLVGDFKLDNNRGTDALSIYWYNRNLRIFRNLQNINDSEEDRILVIFGSGHIQILKQLFECSPEFELIPFNDL
jgi:hypothetical protein